MFETIGNGCEFWIVTHEQTRPAEYHQKFIFVRFLTFKIYEKRITYKKKYMTQKEKSSF